MSGKLHLVGTPIGNLEDMSFRAVRVLKEADLILAEDTRRTRGLLTHFGLKTPLASCHEHNEREMAAKAIAWLLEGQELALVTDAGLPGISDPGQHLLREAVKNKIPVEVIPGPTAFVLALIISGLPTERFTFWGFPPRKGGKRLELFQTALSRPETGIFYEAPTRLASTLKELAELAPARPAAVARELTKVYEEVQRGSLAELAGSFRRRPLKGEFCLVIQGQQAEEKSLADAVSPAPDPVMLVSRLEAEGLERKEAMRAVARQLGVSRREIYRQVLAVRPEKKKDPHTK
ncbi:MAG: 16S rRNA (cytidine(1402)-2'-O)-methyltransferase [Firmicutes bacterium]|nr:16S rRNA (cytidine(1402)-2'-O)-methyltransferase [Bacillota bacterium]